MGIRIAAAVAAAAIVIALAAAFLAGHHAPVGGVPAGEDPKAKAYQNLMSSDYVGMTSASSNHCNTIDDQGCGAAVAQLTPALQKWISDLQSFQTPARFAVLDRQMRSHLGAAVTELNAAVAFQKAGNTNSFNFAMNAVFFERAWVDPTSFAVMGTYSRLAGSFQDAVRLARQSLDACINGSPAPGDLGCSQVSSNTCLNLGAQVCEGYVQSAATQLQTFLIALIQNPPSSALASREDAQLQNDLAQADDALTGITLALMKGDAATAGQGQSTYVIAIGAAAGHAGSIASS